MKEVSELPEVLDNSTLAEIALNDLIKGMNRAVATRYLKAQVETLQTKDYRADNHAGNLLAYYTDARNSVLALSGLTIVCHVDGFKRELLEKAKSFIGMEDNAKVEYLRAVNSGEKWTAESFAGSQ